MEKVIERVASPRLDAETPLEGCETDVMKALRGRQRRETLHRMASGMSRDLWDEKFVLQKRRRQQQELLHGVNVVMCDV